jgi:hypothetical protein
MENFCTGYYYILFSVICLFNFFIGIGSTAPSGGTAAHSLISIAVHVCIAPHGTARADDSQWVTGDGSHTGQEVGCDV